MAKEFNLEVAIAKLETDVKWLKEDRVSQRNEYLHKKKFIRKCWYTFAVGFTGFISWVFVERDEIRQVLKEWILK